MKKKKIDYIDLSHNIIHNKKYNNKWRKLEKLQRNFHNHFERE